MTIEKRYTDTLRVRIDPELLEQIKREAEKLDIDVSTYIRWCVRTGLYLEELNTFIRARNQENQ